MKIEPGMANADAVNDDGERGAIILTASVAAQDGQVGKVIYGSCKAGVNGHQFRLDGAIRMPPK